MIATWGEARLLCRGAATACWWTPGGLVWAAAGDGTWVSQGGAVYRTGLRAAGVAWRGDRVLLWSSDGASSELRGGAWVPYATWRWRGLDVRLDRAGGGWTSPDLHLPDGAREARWIRPFPVGLGAMWSSRGWLYRATGAARPRAVDDLRRGEEVEVGPHGAFAIGKDGLATRAAAPGRSPRPLPTPLEHLRWAADGWRVAGVAAHGAVVVDLRAWTATPQGEGQPADAEGHLWLDGAVRLGEHMPVDDLRGGATATSQGLLAGPGGRVWRLDDGSAASPGPCLDDGALAALPDGWASVDLSGNLSHIDPQGVRHPWARLPLDPGDAPDEAWWDGALAVTTLLGQRWRVDEGGSVRPEHKLRAPAPQPLPTGVHIGAGGLSWGGQTWKVRAAGAARCGAGLLAWTHGGLLLHLPPLLPR